MQVSITARHGSLGEGAKAKIQAKAERLARLFERLQAVEITVNLEHEDSPSVDFRVSAEHKHDFVATEQADTVLAAVDGAIHKVEKQLRKYKEKVQDHHRG